MADSPPDTDPVRETVTSADGTAIAYERTGSGPPLVLVHGGAAASHIDWEPVAPRLADYFTVYAMDRRGRGESGDADTYTVEREFEDVAAVVDSIAEPVHLLGHSFGAICALEVALRTDNIAKLVLYEPALADDGDEIFPEELLQQVDDRLDANDMVGALTVLLQSVGYSDEDIGRLSTEELWRVQLEAAPTVTRELRALNTYRFNPDRFGDHQIPTGLVTGSESPTLFQTSTATLDEGLSNSRIITLPGQTHEAVTAAPDLFVEKIASFLRE
jgi:pimeloyl-ACP methyl ester carboxylesterase